MKYIIENINTGERFHIKDDLSSPNENIRKLIQKVEHEKDHLNRVMFWDEDDDMLYSGIGYFDLRFEPVTWRKYNVEPDQTLKDFLQNENVDFEGDIDDILSITCLYIHNIDKIPSEIGLLVGLEVFYIESDTVKSIPKEISKLDCLESFTINNDFNNMIKNIPELPLSTCQISIKVNTSISLPKNLKELKFLEYFDFRNARGKVKLPDEVLRLPKLRHIMTYGPEAVDISKKALEIFEKKGGDVCH